MNKRTILIALVIVSFSLIPLYFFFNILEKPIYIKNRSSSDLMNLTIYAPGHKPRVIDKLLSKESITIGYPNGYNQEFIQVGFIQQGVEKILDIGEVSTDSKVEIYIYNGNYTKLYITKPNYKR